MACWGVEQQLQNVVKAVKARYFDNYIKEKSSMSYFWEVIKRVNEKEDAMKTRTLSFMVSKVIQIEQHMIISE